MSDMGPLHLVLDEIQDAEPVILSAPNAPMAVAGEMVAARYRTEAGDRTLYHWRGGWWRWQTTRWIEVEHREIRAEAYQFCEHASYVNGDGKQCAWSPTRNKVANLLEALAAVSHLSEHVDQPGWLDGRDTGRIVAVSNGLLDVTTGTLMEHAPQYFNQAAVPFAYQPGAPPAGRWLRLLHQELWPDDSKQVRALQEFFGYIISGRLDMHKIMLLVGPTRAGKGVISRILGALIGHGNVCGPTLSSLSTDFGLAPLLGKPLAVISDARMSGRNSSTTVERLLSISGEDLITINRKYREQWTGKLPTRFVICSNELPRLADAAAAIAGRFVTLQLERSWLGREDLTLERELEAEMAGILNWALAGLRALDAQGAFTRPTSTDEAYTTLQDLASPVTAFIRDACVTGAEHEIAVDDLWRAWREWAEDNGVTRDTKAGLGRNLRAAIPSLRRGHRGGRDEHRIPVYKGISLRDGVTQ
jgi:putative DNA primase/helicase